MTFRIGKAALRSAASVSLLALTSATTLAQDIPAPATDGAASGEAPIVVTGTRIRRPELVGLEPTASVDETYLQDRNLTNVADALNENPLIRGSITPQGNQASFGNGANFINLFGLGSVRTLTLINGRRVVSSHPPTPFGPSAQPGLQVDLNIVPAILIDRIDQVSIGGAPVYGSDAIAGTVNVILKERYDRVKLQATSGITSQGDGFTRNVSALAGRDFAGGRGNVTIAASYDKVDGLRGNDRAFNRDNVGFLDNCTGAAPPAANDGRVNPNIGCNNGAADGVPTRILFRNLASPLLSTGGVIFAPGPTGLQFDGLGGVVPVVPGTRQTGIFSSGSNGFTTSDQDQITSDLRRISASLFASYELTQEVELFTELLYYDSRAQAQGTSPTFNSPLAGGTSGALVFATATTPFLTPAARAALLARGIPMFMISRSNEDLVDQSPLSETELKRGVAGARGDFSALGRDLNYEVSFTYGKNDIHNLSTQINQQRFVNAVNAAAGPNGAVCTLTPTVPAASGQTPIADPNCVPLNLLGAGQASPAALAYISQATDDRSSLEQWVFNANVGGTLFDLWAGPVSFNLGYEHRNEKAAFVPDAFTRLALGRNPPVAAVSGKFNLDELFGEVLVPLVSPDNGIPFLHSVEAFGRVRHVNNTVNGGFTSWAAGGKIAPIPDIAFRGNFTRSFRAPSVTELFLPQALLLTRPQDLCTAANRNAGPAPAVRAANCAAFLAAAGNPANYILQASQVAVPALNGGNPNLANEQADSYTFGAIVQPRFVPGLTLTADYVNIKIDGQIINIGSDALMPACFDNPNFDANDALRGNTFCRQLGFDATGQIPNDSANPAVRSGYVNGQRIEFEAITGTLDYRRPLSALGLPGSVGLGGDLLYVMRRKVDNTGVAPARSDGVVGDPKLSAQGRLNYYGDNWGFGAVVNFVGRQLVSRFNRGPNPNDIREFDHLKPFATVSANLYFLTRDEFRMNLAVTNLFNRQGQSYFGTLIPSGAIPGALNDEIGRRFSVTVSKEF